jgi:hypothetical protein
MHLFLSGHKLMCTHQEAKGLSILNNGQTVPYCLLLRPESPYGRGALVGAEFGVVCIGQLGFVMLPNAGLGGGSADVEAYAGGQEIGVDGGGGSSSFAVESAD